MLEYKTNGKDFVRRTRRRVIIETFSIALIAIFFWSDGLPGWLEITAISILVLYVLMGLAFYPKAKSVADKFSIHISNDSLGFTDRGKIKKLPYSDLAISKVIKKQGEVVEIRLRTAFGQTIKLRGLENMQELYSELAQKIKEA